MINPISNCLPRLRRSASVVAALLARQVGWTTHPLATLEPKIVERLAKQLRPGLTLTD